VRAGAAERLALMGFADGRTRFRKRPAAPRPAPPSAPLDAIAAEVRALAASLEALHAQQKQTELELRATQRHLMAVAELAQEDETAAERALVAARAPAGAMSDVRRGARIDDRVPGWMTRPELELIARVAAAVPEGGVVVEIGSFAGRSSVQWAANSDPSVSIYCMDPFDMIVDDFSFEFMHGDREGVRGRPCGELFAEHTSAWANRLTAITQASPPPSWDRPADVVFIDGDHSFEGVTRDLEFWIEHVKPGGRTLGHDWQDAGVRDAVQAFAGRRSLVAVAHPRTHIWELLARA
jgi:hypothetical protein